MRPMHELGTVPLAALALAASAAVDADMRELWSDLVCMLGDAPASYEPRLVDCAHAALAVSAAAIATRDLNSIACLLNWFEQG